MSDLRQDVIEALIFNGPKTAQQLARRFNRSWESMMTTLEDLAQSGQVCTQFNRRPGDMVCSSCHDYEVEDAEPGEQCDWCQRRLVDDCRWVFCGGPISQALSMEGTANA